MKALTHFLNTYQQIDRDNLWLLSTIYEEEVIFTDPLHTIHGLDGLQEYFARLYDNVEDIAFDFNHRLDNGNEACIQWRMHFTHRRLAAGRPVVVDGVSVIRFSERGKVEHHRDYFDLGSMVYEHIPLVGGIISYLKKRVST